MSRTNETRIGDELRRLVSEHYTRLDLDAATRSEPKSRRDAGHDVVAFVAGVIVGATIAAVHIARRP